MIVADTGDTPEEGLKPSSDFLRGDLSRQPFSAEAKISENSHQFHGNDAQHNRGVRRERTLVREELE